MTEKFDNKFHQRYVGGEGEVKEDTRPVVESRHLITKKTLEEVLEEYRSAVHDPKAELPDEILKTLLGEQRTENDRT